MSMNYSVRAGYGFVLEGLEKSLKSIATTNSNTDDLKLFEVDVEITDEHKMELVDKFYQENSLEECSLEIAGDFSSGAGVSIVVFLNNYEAVSVDGPYTEKVGTLLFDDEISVSSVLKKDIDKLKNYFRFINDEPKPVVAVSFG